MAPVFLAAITILAYTSSFGGAFLFDDARRLGTDATDTLRRPVVGITFAAQQLAGLTRSADYHAVNLAIHVASVLLLFGILRRTLRLPSAGGLTDSRAVGLGWAAAALWAVHPLTTSAVTYISQRYEIMMAMFYLLTLYAVVRGATQERCHAAWYAMAVLACGLGMASKEVMVTAPIAVLLFDWLLLSAGRFRVTIRRRWWVHLLLLATWGLLWAVMQVEKGEHAGGYVWRGFAPVEYLATEMGVLLRYLRLSVWPTGLCLDYAWPAARSAVDVIPGAAVLAVMGLVALLGLFRRRAWAYPLCWFFLVLLPTSSIVPRPDAIMEHRMYLPLAGLVALVALWVYIWLRRLGVMLGLSARTRTATVSAVLVVALLILGALTFHRNRVYASELRMWEDVVRKRPNNHRAYVNLAASQLSSGDFRGTVASCSELLRHLPDFSRREPGYVPSRVSSPGDAVTYRQARHYVHAHNTMGVALVQTGSTQSAVRHFEEAVRLLPQFESARSNLERALQQQTASTTEE